TAMFKGKKAVSVWLMRSSQNVHVKQINNRILAQGNTRSTRQRLMAVISATVLTQIKPAGPTAGAMKGR
ncbi:MAG: hypothetical protein R3311_22445, partial [Oceanisphaera sp.]|nr:hypothetical protein [Oceanisphaera sp.]